MDFRILGSLQVFDGDGEIGVSGGKLRALLALLLLRANHAVSEDVLIEALWGEDASAKAGRNLHVLVSRLRASIGPDRLLREAGGYLIRVEDGELDVARFERLRREHRPAEALAIWRGPPLADFAYEGWAQNEIRRLEELRLVALEERIESDLASGDHAELVGELQMLVAEHPLRETLRRHLIVALYRSGRQAEALEAYRAARRMLDEELGLEPSPALRELEGAVLRQDPGLDAPSRMRALVPRGGRRRRALAVVAAALLGFAGLAAAGVLVQRDDGDRRASAANRPGPTGSTSSPPTSSPSLQERAVPAPKAFVVRSRRTQPSSTRRNGTETQSSRARSGPIAQPAAPAPSEPRASPQPPQPPANKAPAQPPPTTTSPPTTMPTTPDPEPPPIPTPPRAQTRIEDDFNDGVINRSIWQRSSTDGVSIEEMNGRLEMSVAASAVAGGEYNIINGALGSTCRFQGDFDVRVDFELLNWPVAGGVMAELSSWYSAYTAAVGRFSGNNGREEYAGWFPAGSNSIATSHSAGTLRIVREGTQTTAQYRSADRWRTVATAQVTGAPLIGLQLYSRDDWFADKGVRVAFDNYVLMAEQPGC